MSVDRSEPLSTSPSARDEQGSHMRQEATPLADRSADIGSMWGEFLKATVPEIPPGPYCDLTATPRSVDGSEEQEKKNTAATQIRNGSNLAIGAVLNESDGRTETTRKSKLKSSNSDSSNAAPVLGARIEEYRSHRDRQMSKKLLNDMCDEFEKLEYESLVDANDHH